MLRATPAGVEFDVRVIPRARNTAVGGVRDGVWVVRLSAPPVDGAANDALVQFLSKLLDVPPRAIRIVSGERSRRKRVAIGGVTADAVKAALDRRAGLSE
jgi:uncharacterized protein (TIGR00251 family)